VADKIEKFLSRLSEKEAEFYRGIIKAILSDAFDMYDVKKLSGHPHVFRIRKGKVRVVFERRPKGIEIIHIGNRDENTYRNY
jgi:mRNA-degrading endonuclease RelE of RelBE toxin-antitoxin system